MKNFRIILCFTILITLGTFIISGCKQKQSLFREVKGDKSGIHFNNEIKEDEELNVLYYEYIYNGGGVGIGDFNNDSLPDIYFTGNLVPNKLYINRGNMKFEDVTDTAGVSGNGRWSKGVSIVDINNDGLDDIYVSAAVRLPASERKNLLYINKGADKKALVREKHSGVVNAHQSQQQRGHVKCVDQTIESYLLAKRPRKKHSDNQHHHVHARVVRRFVPLVKPAHNRDRPDGG